MLIVTKFDDVVNSDALTIVCISEVMGRYDEGILLEPDSKYSVKAQLVNDDIVILASARTKEEAKAKLSRLVTAYHDGKRTHFMN